MQEDVTTAFQGTGVASETWVPMLIILCMCYNYKHKKSIICIIKQNVTVNFYVHTSLSSIVPTHLTPQREHSEGKAGDFLSNA